MKPRRLLSGKAFARLDGSTPVTVRRARQTGHLVADEQGRYDPELPVNQSWLEREKQPTTRGAVTAAAKLAAANARLETLEYDVEVRRAFYIDRKPVATWLHTYADLLTEALRAFPDDRYLPLLCGTGDPAKFRAVFRRRMAEHLAGLGDMHALIEAKLDEAGTRWRGFRPEPRKGEPDLTDLWEAATTLAEAERRRAVAVTEIERMKIGVRKGVLLADWPARKTAADLVIGWRQSCTEHFAVRNTAEILAEMGRNPSHEAQWTLFQLLEHVMKSILVPLEWAAVDDPLIYRRFLPAIGPIRF